MIVWRDLSLQHPRGPLLRFPDLRLEAGRVLLLRGASGTGKSSLLALLAGLLTPTTGEIEVDGTPLHRLSPRQRDAWRAARLGVLPQRLHLSESLSVADNLALVDVAVGRPVDRRAIAHVLQALGVSHLAACRPPALSGGEAQRVA
ncbi:ATP-binding cassette domain-containing protein, partial [Caldimonas sp.]|uniref:ATP-binding cassette domain-containing protein n=1 Tax=Caldimonas sp. TaxID=2838790 RepID=UPI0039193D07